MHARPARSTEPSGAASTHKEDETMPDPAPMLAGLRVLDVGTFIFGPAAATVMADFGADVIKIEHPRGGDPYRYLVHMPPLPACADNYCWLLDGRGKRSVALDLKAEDGRAVLLRLVRDADVFVTNFHPSVVEALGIADGDLRPLNPRLVYAHATGYGETGPEVEKPGYDATAWWARSGLMDVVRVKDGEPGTPVPGMGDHPSAMALFGAIMLALYQRERTGRGVKVSSSLMANGVWANAVYAQAMLCGSEPYRHISHIDTPNAVVNAYATRDRRWLLLLLIQEDKDWERFARAVERPDLLGDPRFAAKDARRAHARDLAVILDAVFAAKDFAEWRAILDRHAVTFGVISRLEDLPDDPQMRATGVFVDLDDPSGRRLRTVSSPIWVAGHPKVAPRRAPEIGEHTAEVLGALGYDAATIEALRARGVIR
jgi:crotonobetainyl-CoA:carnitine CoA-transferase CaiB-like acyl-CoA transferase